MLYFFAKMGFAMLSAAFLSSFLRVDIIAVFALFLAGCGVCAGVFFKKSCAAAVLVAASLGCLIVGAEVLFNFYPAAALDGAKAEISGTVKYVSAAGGNPVYTVDTDFIGIEGAPQEITVKITGWDDNSAKPFDKISCTVSFIAYAEEPGEEFFSNRSAGVSVYAYTETPFEVTGREDSSFGYLIYLIREKISSVIYEYFIDWHAPFMEQLLIGTKGELDYEISSAFRKSGMSHILAISGLHMSILVLALEKQLRRLTDKELMDPLARDLILMGVTFLYMFIGGFGSSITRSGFMLIIHYLTKMFFRGSKAQENLGIAIVIILVSNPMSCCDAGFIMSAVSSLALSVFAEPFANFLAGFYKSERFLETAERFTHIIAVDIVAFLSVLPVSAIYFGEVSLLAPLANIIAGTFARFSLILGFVTVLLGFLPFFGFFAGGTAFLAMLSNRVMLETAKLFSFSQVETDTVWLFIWIIGSAVLIIVPALYSGGFQYIKKAFVFSGIIFAAGALSCFVFFSGVTKIEVTALEHGTAVVCSGNGNSVLTAHGLGAHDRLELDFDAEYSAVISLEAVSDAAEKDMMTYSKPDFAMLTFEDITDRFENARTFQQGSVELRDNAKVHIISEGVFCMEFDEISLLYISEKFDIMDIEPKFRRAEIIILDGVSPKDFPVLRCEYMILRDMGGFYSGTSELITLRNGKAEFSAYGRSVVKGLH